MPAARALSDLQRIVPLLRCPETFTPLQLVLADHVTLVSEGGRVWNCRDYVPLFYEDIEIVTFPKDHLSNALAPVATSLINNTEGLVLNLSAGGSERPNPKVIEVEAGIFRNTDVVADSHRLPFKDNVFDACIAMNAFEHYHSPHTAAKELFRVTKPGGHLLIHTAFMQPIHEAPHHYYNATRYGVANWFADFKTISIATSANFNPLYSISWFASQLDLGLRSHGMDDQAAEIGSMTLSSLADFWRANGRFPARIKDAFFSLPPDLQDQLAAGVEFVGMKPL